MAQRTLKENMTVLADWIARTTHEQKVIVSELTQLQSKEFAREINAFGVRACLSQAIEKGVQAIRYLEEAEQTCYDVIERSGK